MKKKQMLATLVMLSLLQGSVYAGQISSGTYENEYIYTHPSYDRGITIDTAGDYDFKGGLIIDRKISNLSSAFKTALIGKISNATEKNEVLTITIGGEEQNNRVKMQLTNTTTGSVLHRDIIRVGGDSGDYSNIININ